ncbi:hypothetical protein B4135_3231 [Caldibacillus debilis]|uniref:Uncharacterized protein n=1 Tax=Caldibacillus debilis TaxID=301148 RepID=A0A150LGN8_9BACI|nr:hypothetical protein B4135_3231 [Caldibacillus debilis]
MLSGKGKGIAQGARMMVELILCDRVREWKQWQNGIIMKF